MSSPIVIHLHRPYASEEEYIAHERFSIDAKSMLLIDQPALPLDTAVVFDVTLDNGQKPIRAEARVVGYIETEGDRPGGLRVRFRRFGAATKAFIDRAVNGTSAVTAAASMSIAPALDSAPNASLARNPSLAAAVVSLAPAVEASAAATPVLDAPAALAPSAAPARASITQQRAEPSNADEASGIHKKTGVPPVAAPANREALLARLRGRRVG